MGGQSKSKKAQAVFALCSLTEKHTGCGRQLLANPAYFTTRYGYQKYGEKLSHLVSYDYTPVRDTAGKKKKPAITYAIPYPSKEIAVSIQTALDARPAAKAAITFIQEAGACTTVDDYIAKGIVALGADGYLPPLPFMMEVLGYVELGNSKLKGLAKAYNEAMADEATFQSVVAAGKAARLAGFIKGSGTKLGHVAIHMMGSDTYTPLMHTGKLALSLASADAVVFTGMVQPHFCQENVVAVPPRAAARRDVQPLHLQVRLPQV